MLRLQDGPGQRLLGQMRRSLETRRCPARYELDPHHRPALVVVALQATRTMKMCLFEEHQLGVP